MLHFMRIGVFLALFMLIRSTHAAPTVLLADDFTDPAGDMSPAGAAENVNPPWRWNESGGSIMKNVYDGVTSLNMPVDGGWNQYIDTAIPGGVVSKNVAYVAIFKLPAGGGAALGFARDVSWDNGASPQKNRIFKLKADNSIHFSGDHLLTGADQATGQSYVPDTAQGLMILGSGIDGSTTIWYQNGGDHSTSSANWVNITPGSDPMGNLVFPAANISLAGVNGIGDNSGLLNLDYIAVIQDPDLPPGAPPFPTPTPTPTPTPGPEPGESVVLFVVDSATADPTGDNALRTYMDGLDNVFVWTVDDDDTLTSQANGADLIMISSTVASGKVTTAPDNNKYRDVAVGLICWENGNFDDLKMTLSSGGTDAGAEGGQTQITITNAAHPLAGGLSGTVTVSSVADSLRWGNPSGAATGAVRVAQIVGQPSRSAIFAYEMGAQMEGMVAPARRVGIFLGDSLASKNLTSSGTELLRSAIAWASGGAVPVELSDFTAE